MGLIHILAAMGAGVFERYPEPARVVRRERHRLDPHTLSTAWTSSSRTGSATWAKLKPSENWQRQCKATFQHDVIGPKLIGTNNLMTVDTLMWGSDYPHTDGIWLIDDILIEEQFGLTVSPRTSSKITCENAAKFYNSDELKDQRDRGGGLAGNSVPGCYALALRGGCDVIHGACHCGSVAFEAEVDPETVRICHCTDCQTTSGSLFRANIMAPGETFRMVRGSPKVYIKTADSGNQRAQAFCADCGTGLYATSPTRSIPRVTCCGWASSRNARRSVRGRRSGAIPNCHGRLR